MISKVINIEEKLEKIISGEYVTEDMEEILKHGSDDFRMSVHKTCLRSNIDNILYYHWHEELEFLFLDKGSAQFSIGGERMEVSSGDVVIIQPNIPHSAFRKDPGEIVFYAITVHFSFLSSLENDRIQQKYVLPIFLQNQKYPYHITPSMDKNQQILSRLQTIKETYIYEKPGYELLIKSQLFEIFYLLEQYVYENNKKQCNQQMKFCHNSSTVKSYWHIYKKIIKIESRSRTWPITSI